MIYLASPYTHKDPNVVADRVQKAGQFAAEKIANGFVIFSPVIYGTSILQYAELPSDWAFWSNFCNKTLLACSEVWVLQIDGWEESEGVLAEIKLAEKLKIR